MAALKFIVDAGRGAGHSFAISVHQVHQHHAEDVPRLVVAVDLREGNGERSRSHTCLLNIQYLRRHSRFQFELTIWVAPILILPILCVLVSVWRTVPNTIDLGALLLQNLRMILYRARATPL